MCRSLTDHLFYRWLIILPLLGSIVCLGFSPLNEPDLSTAGITFQENYGHPIFGNQPQAETPQHFLLVEVSENSNQEDSQEEEAGHQSVSGLTDTANFPLSADRTSHAQPRVTSTRASDAGCKKYILFQSLKLDC
ncbi:hypothetical protein [Flavilitoribacter nigricans]|uniref:Uncharacterized protein n=1 Tax=Flavilitoribacter nigricans (strain ATCC 23147 / DSM 23189 / NBRC 102662 / NCIMB 1420 / SS-2) TaxID=1122177 RepID=A0A2D0NIK5_FLAN2|nr:hypothetical protein [Flavilitoribacter nigricans]PHN08220.1 hypothetical protein CRP01_02545 [Flavilitoribacter nigricans DSM 23189 = NBRC 102662]